MFSSPPYHVAIIGGGIAGFSTAGNLVNAFMDAGIHKVKALRIIVFQPPFALDETALSQEQLDRVILLKKQGIVPEEIMGCGMVFNPLEPSLFTFNGDSSAPGFDFARRVYKQDDYFTWLQQNRETIAALYPDFVPDSELQRHPHHDIDAIKYTSPRGAYGLYLNARFTQLQEFAAQHNIAIEVMPYAVSEVNRAAHNKLIVKLENNALVQADSVVCATGYAYQPPHEFTACVFSSYPTQGYNAALKNAAHVAVIGAGPAGIETALHLLYNLGVEQVSMISKSGHSRLPHTVADAEYIPLFLTREQFSQQPDAAHLEYLLQQEVAHCYRQTQLPCPQWPDLTAITDYLAFMERYQQEVNGMHSPHPLATLVRPVKSFPYKINDIIPEKEKIAVAHVFARMEHLFGSQSVPSAELMMQARKEGRLSLHAGAIDREGTIRPKNGEGFIPDGSILATGFDASPNLFYQQMVQNGLAMKDSASGIGIKQESATGRILSPGDLNIPVFAVYGSSLSSVNGGAQIAAKSLARHITSLLTHVEKLKIKQLQNNIAYENTI